MRRKYLEERKIKEQIPYHRPYPLSNDDRQALEWEIGDVIKSGLITNGVNVQKLEERIRQLYNVKHCIATTNCTLGLTLCYQYFGQIEVIHQPNFTWMSPYLMNYMVHEIAFHDINPDTWLVDFNFDKIGREDLLAPNHTFGNIIEIHRDNPVIYDGAHALGSWIKEIGDATVFSLAPTKLITSCEGGMVITNNDDLAEFVKFRRDKCARMSEVHALVGLKTLFYLNEVKRWKKSVYSYYKRHIPGQFQQITHTSNYNTIGFLNIYNLDIPEHIETRQYYEPIFDEGLFSKSYHVYNKIICLPSWYGVDYMEIVHNILEANKL